MQHIYIQLYFSKTKVFYINVYHNIYILYHIYSYTHTSHTSNSSVPHPSPIHTLSSIYLFKDFVAVLYIFSMDLYCGSALASGRFRNSPHSTRNLCTEYDFMRST